MFMIYTTENCVWCEKTKDLLKEQNMEYTNVILDTQEKISEFKKNTGHKTVPQIYLESSREYIGGYDDLNEFLTKRLETIQHGI
tara:strand:+ start:1822 stop:2073 length:252 start_codon:yes stop_codon:yes gene_type:complete